MRAVSVGLGVATFTALTVALWGYIVDDAFISLRYARHFAEGHGLVYNVGEPVEGITNLLWTVLLSAGFVLPIDPVWWMKGLSVALGLVAAWLIGRLATRSGLVPDGEAWLPSTLWLLLPIAATSAGESLETMLFSCLLLGALWAAVDGAALTCGAIVAALTLTRPDGILLLPVVVVWLSRRAGWRAVVRCVAAPVIVLGLVEWWRLAFYGEWLPNTFYAKSGGSLLSSVTGVRSFLAFWPVAGAGAWLLAGPTLRQPAAWLLAAAAATRLAFHLWSGGPWMGEHRFLVPMVPLVVILTMAGTLRLTRRPIAVAAAVAVFLLPAWFTFPATAGFLRAYAAGMATGYEPLGLHLGATLPPGASFACGDAGAIAYYADRPAIDILGLNDHHIARQPGRFSVDKHDPDYVLRRQPAAIVLLSETPDGGPWMTPADAAIATHPAFQAAYRFEGSWPLLDRYHLLLFRRAE